MEQNDTETIKLHTIKATQNGINHSNVVEFWTIKDSKIVESRVRDSKCILGHTSFI